MNFYSLDEKAMVDTNQNPSTPANVAQINQESWTKKPFFWGNEAVFENLEKFEQISNPTGDHQDFDFSFTDEDQESPTSISNSSEQVSAESLWEIKAEEDISALQDVGLENIFQPQQTEEKADLDPLSTLYTQEEEYDSDETDNASLEIEVLPHENSPVLEEESESEETPLQSFESEIPEKSLDTAENEEVSISPELGFEREKQEVNEPENPESDIEEIRTDGQDESSMSYEQEDISSPIESDGSEGTLDERNSEKSTEQLAALEIESEPENELSDLMKKYQELFEMAKKILKLENKMGKGDSSDFEILGNSTEKSMIIYNISPMKNENDHMTLTLKKQERDFARNEESEHILTLEAQEKSKNLIVTVDGVLLYEEEKDLQDPLKAMQVADKINKFKFLFEQRVTELEEKWEEIKAEKEKMRAFRDIFRNF